MVNQSWTDSQIKQLKTLWSQGHSASEVAKIMGRASRSSVIGKVHRLGLEKRVTTHGGARTAKPKVVLVALPEPPPLTLDGAPITPLTLEVVHCKWPFGDTRESDFHYCGHARVLGSPYCQHHKARAFQPLKPQKEAVE